MLDLKQYSNCSIMATGQSKSKIADYQGSWLVLYFYPKDATPGCTQEGIEFSNLHAEFADLNAYILGVSRDDLVSHQKFKDKQGFKFELIADIEEHLCQAFDVIKEKNMYGKNYMGIERSTFLLDPQSNVRHVWRKVKVPGHAAEVLATLKGLLA